MSVFVMSCIVALASAEAMAPKLLVPRSTPASDHCRRVVRARTGVQLPPMTAVTVLRWAQLALATIYIAQVVFAAELRLAPVATIPSFVLLWVGLLVSWCIFPAMFCDIWRACSRSRRRAGLSRPSAWVAGDAVSRGAGSGSSVVQTSGSATARSAHQRGDQASRSVGTAQASLEPRGTRGASQGAPGGSVEVDSGLGSRASVTTDRESSPSAGSQGGLTPGSRVGLSRLVGASSGVCWNGAVGERRDVDRVLERHARDSALPGRGGDRVHRNDHAYHHGAR